MKNINVFTGNIQQLISKLQSHPNKATEQDYLKFAGEKSPGEVYTKLQNGCPSLFAKYQKEETFTAPYTNTGTGYNYANEGLFFDVATYLSGQPEHWFNECENTQNKPAQTIIINLNAPHWVNEKSIFNKLKKVIDFIDECEATGTRLNIIGRIFSHEANYLKTKKYTTIKEKTFEMLVEIKTENEPINLQQLIYLIASPVLLRYCFLWFAHDLKQKENNNFCAAYEHELNENNTENFCIPSISYDYINGKTTYNSKTGFIDYSKPLTTLYPHLCK